MAKILTPSVPIPKVYAPPPPATLSSALKKIASKDGTPAPSSFDKAATDAKAEAEAIAVKDKEAAAAAAATAVTATIDELEKAAAKAKAESDAKGQLAAAAKASAASAAAAQEKAESESKTADDYAAAASAAWQAAKTSVNPDPAITAKAKAEAAVEARAAAERARQLNAATTAKAQADTAFQVATTAYLWARKASDEADAKVSKAKSDAIAQDNKDKATAEAKAATEAAVKLNDDAKTAKEKKLKDIAEKLEKARLEAEAKSNDDAQAEAAKQATALAKLDAKQKEDLEIRIAQESVKKLDEKVKEYVTKLESKKLETLNLDDLQSLLSSIRLKVDGLQTLIKENEKNYNFFDQAKFSLSTDPLPADIEAIKQEIKQTKENTEASMQEIEKLKGQVVTKINEVTAAEEAAAAAAAAAAAPAPAAAAPVYDVLDASKKLGTKLPEVAAPEEDLFNKCKKEYDKIMEKNDVYTEAVKFAKNLELKKSSTKDILTYVFAYVKAKINELLTSSGWTIAIDPASNKPHYVKGGTPQWELPKEVSDAIDLVFFQYPDAMLKKINYICSYNECESFITNRTESTNPTKITDLTFVTTTSVIAEGPTKLKVKAIIDSIKPQLESLLTTSSKNTEVTDAALIGIIKKYDATIGAPITFEKALIIFFTNYTTIITKQDEYTSFVKLIFSPFLIAILSIYNMLQAIYSFLIEYFNNLPKGKKQPYMPAKGKLDLLQGGRKKRYLKNKSINNKNIYKRSKKNKHTRKSK